MKAAIRAAVLGILLGGSAATCGWAADPSAPAPAPTPADAQLTNESLKAMLVSLQFDPKVQSKGYLITIKRDDWTFYVQLTLSGDGSKLGLNANLGQIDNPDAVKPEQWKALLMSNEDIDPSFFYFDATLKKLMLHHVLDNRAISADFLKQQIDQFVSHIQHTEPLWNFAK